MSKQAQAHQAPTSEDPALIPSSRTQTSLFPAQDPEADQALVAEIKSKLDARDELRGSRIELDSVGGVVTLRGVVVGLHRRSIAGAVSRSTRGVRAVNNLLRVCD